MRGLALGLLVLGGGALAQGAAPPATPASAPEARLPAVEIRSRRDDPVEQRRQSSAAKIVVGREEIEQYGDTSLGEVLRRLPGVTLGGRPGRGGEVRLRGMGGGYTQILVDGERTPPGFSLEQLSRDLVERIEILRAPTAETGTRAIAGTINIVLREPLQRRRDELRGTVTVEDGLPSPHASWTRERSFGDGHGLSTTLNASRSHQRNDTASRRRFEDPGAAEPALDLAGEDHATSLRHNLNLATRIQWRLGPGEQAGLQPFLLASRSTNRGDGTLAALAGEAPYATRASEGSSSYRVARLAGHLTRRVAPETRLELRGQLGGFGYDSRSALRQADADGSPRLEQASDLTLRDRSASLTGKLLVGLGEGHALVGGAELETVRRTENTVTLVDGVVQEGDFGIDVQARTQRHALYLQDEWDPAPGWSAYLGLRAETLRTRSDNGVSPVDSRHTVVSPLAHVVWRYAAPKRDQLRASLTQSWRAPSLANLLTVPALDTLYPVPGGNVASSPDRTGNPALKPEIAHGIDVAWERYLPGGGVVSVNVFHRRIRDVIRTVTLREEVPWADVPRWVARPRNLGRATAQGLEFDGRFRLDEWQRDWPGVALRLNLSLYRSDVDSVPGPDNRIDQQPPASGNLGADWRLPGSGWTLGGTLGWTPAYRTRLTELAAQSLGRRRVIDAYALWQASPSTRWRLGLSNLVPEDSLNTSSVRQGEQLQTLRSAGRNQLAASLQLEVKL